MTGNLETVVYLIALGAIAVGMSLSIAAMAYRTESAPKLFAGLFNPRYWMPVWKTRPFFTARGFRLYVTGSLMAALGGLICLVNMLV